LIKLAEASEANFRRELERHLQRFFPEKFASLPKEQLDAEIRYGLIRARHHLFESRAEVAHYLNLMFEFGRDFDVDPACPWAARLLAADVPQRMKHLQQCAIAALRKDHRATR
jgi:hypothetical protein